MATNNAPKHDFAPAWLKIPSPDTTKPSTSRQAEQTSDKSSSRTRKRYPSGQNSKFRHHSVDDDYYAYTYDPYSYYNGYGYEKFGMQYTSQPSLFRGPGGPRDGKYQHPNARFGQLNGAFPGYYEMTPYDYYGEAYYNGYTSSRLQQSSSTKRGYYKEEGRSNSKEGKDKEGEKKDTDKDKPFNDDFPSLNGDFDQDTKGSKQLNGTGVWDNPPLGKGKDDLKTGNTGIKTHGGLQLYRSLLPNKTSVSHKTGRDGLRLNGSWRDQPIGAIKPPTSSGSHSKESTHVSPTPPMDILNTRLVTTPKTLGDKKSQFLKTLRKENASKAEDGEKTPPEKQDKEPENKPGENQLVNGIDNLGIEETHDSCVLSSSLEAEQRLLREMGWNEEDEEYEITEDDMKEFQNRSKQAQQQRNGLVRTLPKTWSPKHIPVYQADMQELNEPLSSDSDDSL
ncbi:hypothetical protein CHS0354_006247 [Potamilus streckersoni]|uniref:Vasculin n=1 Tax=Potamilus streckersoni TaxID=2493646 RepID=A0AAE0S4A8_9BIVA|nr:hypothetical protein CHS0354_006247 [Potamilus streckersoni]